LRYWLTPKAAKAAFYPPRLGPDRADLLTQLGLPLAVEKAPLDAAA
jgi:hypothetical protein